MDRRGAVTVGLEGGCGTACGAACRMPRRAVLTWTGGAWMSHVDSVTAAYVQHSVNSPLSPATCVRGHARPAAPAPLPPAATAASPHGMVPGTWGQSQTRAQTHSCTVLLHGTHASPNTLAPAGSRAPQRQTRSTLSSLTTAASRSCHADKCLHTRGQDPTPPPHATTASKVQTHSRIHSQTTTPQTHSLSPGQPSPGPTQRHSRMRHTFLSCSSHGLLAEHSAPCPKPQRRSTLTATPLLHASVHPVRLS